MKIIRAKDYYDMSRKAANIISAQVIMKPNCVLGLATGGTPVGTYKQLVEWYNKGDIDFSEVTTVNLDEYRGLPKEHPESYWSFMHRNLFDKVNIDPAKINLPDGTNPDAEDACAKYNQIIHAVGGIDLQLLGIGHDGHIDRLATRRELDGRDAERQARRKGRDFGFRIGIGRNRPPGLVVTASPHCQAQGKAKNNSFHRFVVLKVNTIRQPGREASRVLRQGIEKTIPAQKTAVDK